jgi:hypothetical protein
MNRNSWVAVFCFASSMAASGWLSGYFFGVFVGIFMMKMVGLPFELEPRNDR